MPTYDILMLGLLGVAVVMGARKGFVWQLASLASIAVSYMAAVRYREPLAQRIGGEAPWNAFLAMLILYVGVSLVIWLIFRAVSKTIDELKLKDFDRQLGALLGAAKGVILCTIVTLFAVTLLDGTQRQSIIDSHSGYYIALFLDRAELVIPPEVHDVVGPYLHSLDDRLDDVDHSRLGTAEVDRWH